MEWAELAACKGVNTEWFYPVPGDGYAQARRICQTCPVRTACLDDAMYNERKMVRGQRYGMLGGLTPEERSKLRQKLRKKSAA